MKPDKGIRVTYGRNYMTAFVQIFPGENAARPTFHELREALRSEGIIFGIDEAALAKALEAEFGKSTTVAVGQKPKQGIDGVIHLRETLNKKAPKLLENDRVDFRDLQIVKNVRRGQILAEKEPAIPGRPGTDVRGVPVEASEVKDPELLGGENTAVTPDGTKLLSLIDGHLVIERAANGQPIPGVSKTFLLKKHVDMETGNIDCIGHCVIAGGVTDGFSVVANGNITIKGLAEGAEIVSRTGSVVLERGVKGNNKGRVLAAGSISAKFVENATIECEGDITITEHAYHSRLRSGGSVRLTAAPGVIMGGEAAFTGILECREVGSETEPKTLLYFGDWRAATAVSRMIEIDKVLEELESQAAVIREYLKKMRRLTLEDPERHRKEIDELARLSAPFPRLKERMTALLAEKAEIEPHLRVRESNPTAEIGGNVYTGVILRGENVEEAVIKSVRRGIKITRSKPEKGMLAHFVIKPLRG